MIDLFISLVIFVLGLMIGSFLNCVIYRLENGGSFLKGRSFCPNCKHQLSWQDLVPIFSYIGLGGKCRYCQKSISLQYPLVEIATGILFALLFWHFGFGIDLIFGFLISAFLVVIFVYDLKHYLIPDQIIYPAIALALLYRIFEICLSAGALAKAADLGFGILPSLFFSAIIIFSRGRWMGLGDFKLAVLMGLMLGWPNVLVALFLAFMAGAIMGVGLIIARKKSLKSEVPFGPFLVLGTLVALFWGQILINWYLSFF